MNGKKRNTLSAWVCNIPALAFAGSIVVFPIIYTAYISLTNMNVYHWFDFAVIGFKNYISALSVVDSGFLRALGLTVLWTALNMILQLVIAFVMASLLNIEKLRPRKVYKTLLMFPWAMPGYVSILLWKNGMFNPQFGLLNQWLSGWGSEPVRWLAGDVLAFICCLVVNLWLALPFMIMIMDGALQSVDKSYYENAMLDGAGWFTRQIRLTVPAITPIIAPAVVITLFTTFKQFDVIYLLTQQVGAKTGANIHTVLTYAYENAFVTNNYGFSSAVSIIIFLLLISFALLSKIRRPGNEKNI
ncbi:MAG: sugar ABC transporter permease [Clostridiales bacterium]|jgi:arabinogalactan oligomer/maltooligosaccharide transport system permease protein|nr:sugar ABC transporter permease [Clostridiales bacterium]